MKNTGVQIAGCGLAVCLLLSACGSQAPVNIPDVIRVENAEGTGGQGSQEQRSITVSAEETVNVVPDMARIVYRIVTENRDAVKCQEENGRQLEQVIQYLKEQGLEDSSIRTADFSLNTQYDWSGSRRTLIGYEMSTRLEATDIPVDNVGALLSGGVSAGASEIDSVSYFASSYDEAYKDALTGAMDMALEKAETLAHAGGCQVTDVLSVREYSDSQEGRYVDSGIARFNANAEDLMSDKAMSASGAMAVMPGEMQVSARVEVEYLLLPR